MKEATGNSEIRVGHRVFLNRAVIRAYSKATKRLLADKELTATSESAGFIIRDGQKRGERTGIQVFVKVCRYSDRLLREQPMTGGLLCEVRSKKSKRRP